MAKVHFAPNSAIRYIGTETKEFTTSLARPKPLLKKGDIVIVDRRTAFNLVHKGFGEYENVEAIGFSKDAVAHAEYAKELEEANAALTTENSALKVELAEALKLLAQEPEDGDANTEPNDGDANTEPNDGENA
jgi:hypothetical protein